MLGDQGVVIFCTFLKMFFYAAQDSVAVYVKVRRGLRLVEEGRESGGNRICNFNNNCIIIIIMYLNLKQKSQRGDYISTVLSVERYTHSAVSFTFNQYLVVYLYSDSTQALVLNTFVDIEHYCV